ncbi:MAG: hypothetical protein KF897_05180 [Opitutaceae bacterium]|nr:hypothetical protein [Opitutaceae bacterium]
MLPLIAGAGEAPPRAQTRAALLQEVDRSWHSAGPEPAAPTEADAVVAPTPLQRKLESIVLPELSFTRTEVGQALAALGAAAAEFDATADDAGGRGINLVFIGPDTGGPVVTLALREITLKRALDLVAAAARCRYEVQADAVVVRVDSGAGELETELFPVSRATVRRVTGGADGAAERMAGVGGANRGRVDASAAGGEAEALRGFLQQAGVDFAGTAGSSLAYDGLAIIVTQSQRNLQRIRHILRRYAETRQVEIEAKFMEVQEGALEELGVNWQVSQRADAAGAPQYQTDNRSLAQAFNSSSAHQQGRIVRPEGQATGEDGAVTLTPELDLPILNHAPQIPGTAHVGSGAAPLAAWTGAIGEFDVNAVVRALAQRQGTDLLSAPKITVLSGHPATITVAQEMRYPQRFGQTQSQVGTGNASGGGSAGVAITAGTPEEFATRNVGVELRVTPTVEEDGRSISLELNPKVTEFDGFVEYGGPSVAISGSTTVTVPSGFYQPIFSVRDIATRVTIWDGATLIMGGLTREEVKQVKDKVPVLGDIPLLGRLFRSKAESTQKRNLLIFVTARLVNPAGFPQPVLPVREATAEPAAEPEM